MPRGTQTSATWERQTSLPWTSSAEASPVRTSAVRAEELASLVLEAAYGTSSLELLRKCALAGLSSKTSAVELASGSPQCAESWNDLATRRYRCRLRQLIAERPTSAHAFSSLLAEGRLLPTATARSDRPQNGLLPTLTASSYGSNKGGCAGRSKQPSRFSLRTLLPTLTTTRATYMRSRGKTYAMLNGMVDGPLSPRWLEWFMGFPDGWITSVP